MSNNLNEKVKNFKFQWNISTKDILWLVVIIFLAVMYFTKDNGSEKIKELEDKIENYQDSIISKENLIKESKLREQELYGTIEEKDNKIKELEGKKQSNNDDYKKDRLNVVNLNSVDKVKFLSDKINK